MSDGMEIDPKKLLYFACVIEHGSLNRAARVLQVSQPALTTSMNRLEAEMGMHLSGARSIGSCANGAGGNPVLPCPADPRRGGSWPSATC